MASRLEATVRAQREFTANASHQLRTPLTGLKLRLESALEEAPGDATDLRRQLEAADREADRLAGIVERLLVLARRVEDGASLSVVDLGAVARAACDRFHDKAAAASSVIEVSGTNAPLALADPADVDQMLDALVDNALSYAPGRIRIEPGRADGQVVLAVEDEGPGIPDDEIERVVRRFSRGRDAPPGGTGLGLAIVGELAERSGGQMVIEPGRAHGARVEVRLPAATGDGE
jgi:signal transduction histidine kinase